MTRVLRHMSSNPREVKGVSRRVAELQPTIRISIGQRAASLTLRQKPAMWRGELREKAESTTNHDMICILIELPSP